QRGLRIGIAGHQEGHESRPALTLELCEQCVDASRHYTAHAVVHLSPEGRGRIASQDAIRVRGMDRFKTRARSLRASQTSAEAKLWQALRNRRLAHWKFRRQHPIDRYVVDFVSLSGKLIVQVDGVTHAEPADVRRDDARTKALGFLVVRVTNADVYDNI